MHVTIFQSVQILFGCIYPILTAFSITTQIPLYETIGEKGCVIFWLSSIIHPQSLVVGGLGMAIFRLICIENRTQQLSKNKLVTIIHAFGLALLCFLVTITTHGIVNAGWERAGMYQFCRDFSAIKAGIYLTYLDLPTKHLGN